MCLQVCSLSPDRKMDPEIFFLAKKGVCILSQRVTFPLLGIRWALGRAAVTCQRHTKREEGRFWSPAKYCALLRTETLPAHALGVQTFRWWPPFICMHGKHWPCPLNKGIESFWFTTEACLKTLRREEVEKVTNASLKSEIKRTECHDTRSKVAEFG